MNIPLPSAKAVVECTVQSEFPVEGSAALRQAVDVWTRGVLADVLGDTKGGQVNESAVLSSVENRFLDCAVAEAGQAAHVKDARTLALTLDFQMTRVYETSRAITFCIDAPRYGASGQRLETRVYATFNNELCGPPGAHVVAEGNVGTGLPVASGCASADACRVARVLQSR